MCEKCMQAELERLRAEVESLKARLLALEARAKSPWGFDPSYPYYSWPYTFCEAATSIRSPDPPALQVG